MYENRGETKVTFSGKSCRRRASLLAVIFTAATVVLAGCGGEGGAGAGSSGASGSGASAAKAPDINYDGPDAKFPHSFGEPTPKPGFQFKVGYISLSESVDIFKAGTQVAKQEVERLGGTFIAMDGQLDNQKIVTAFDQLLAQHVDAILVSPADPKALGPSLVKAQAQGVPVFGQDVPSDPSDSLPPGWTASVLFGRDTAPYLLAKAGADQRPGASFAVLGYAQSVGSLQYEYGRFEYWGKRFGLQDLGRVDGASLSPTDIAAGMQALLARHPDVDLVFLGNDSMASAAAAQARAQGNTHVQTSGLSGTQQGLNGVKSGQLFATYRTQVEGINREQVWAMYDFLTKQHSPLPDRVVVPGPVVTKANVDKITPSAAR